MLIVKLLSLFILAAVFFQDIKERAVYWVWFPLLTGTLLFTRLYHNDGPDIWWQTTLGNLVLIVVQLVLVTAYFSWRKRRLVNITNGLLGWGDLLFLLSITVYLSMLNFMFFYIVGLSISLIIWLAIRALTPVKTNKIPLAGFLSVVLFIFLVADWGPHWLKLDDDTWLLILMGK